jgi:hypothetical protein
MKSLADIASAYTEDGWRSGLDAFLARFRGPTIGSMVDAIELLFSGGHPHQRCLDRDLLKEVKKNLTASAHLMEADGLNFVALYEIVSQCVIPPYKDAALLRYDISLCLGASRQIRPKLVYLHSGALTGARALISRRRLREMGFARMPRALPRDRFGELSMLPPHHLENCLCLYKDDLKSLRDSGRLALKAKSAPNKSRARRAGRCINRP